MENVRKRRRRKIRRLARPRGSIPERNWGRGNVPEGGGAQHVAESGLTGRRGGTENPRTSSTLDHNRRAVLHRPAFPTMVHFNGMLHRKQTNEVYTRCAIGTLPRSRTH